MKTPEKLIEVFINVYHLLHVSIEILLHKSENISLHVHVLNESLLHLFLMTSDLAVYPIHCISKILSSRYKGWFIGDITHNDITSL